ncbi:MAG: hypothetical protein K5866_11105, partial [Treponema sp.]|nr:hypothetical protein [Treponema sp.]
MKKIKLALLATMTAFLFLSCDLLTGLNKDTPAAETPTEENKSEEIEKEWFSVETCDTGIKITLADDVSVAKNSGSTIESESIPIKIIITNEDIEAGRKEYIYPFGKKNQDVDIIFNAEAKKSSGSYSRVKVTKNCKSGSGFDYTQYFDMEKFEESLLIAEYTNEPENDDIYASKGPKIKGDELSPKSEEEVPPEPENNEKFTAKLFRENYVKAPELLVNDDIAERVTIVLGELNWANTEWWCENYDADSYNLDSEGNRVYKCFSQGPLYDKKTTAYEAMKKYDYKYAAILIPAFELKSDKIKTQYELKSLWSPQMTAKPLELTDGKWKLTGDNIYINPNGDEGTEESEMIVKISNSLSEVEIISVKITDTNAKTAEPKIMDFTDYFKDDIKDFGVDYFLNEYFYKSINLDLRED